MGSRHSAVGSLIVLASGGCSLLVDLRPLSGDGADAANDVSRDVLPTFCSSLDADFCCDFDKDNLCSINPYTPGDGAVVVYQLDYVSPYYSALETIPPSTGDASVGAFFNPVLQANGRRQAVVDVQVKYSGPATTDTASVGTLLVIGSGTAGVSLQRGSAWRLYLDNYGFIPLAQDIPVDQWVHLRLSVRFDAAPNGALTFDWIGDDGGTTELASLTGVTVLPSTVPLTTVAVLVGPYSIGDAPNASLEIDNVVAFMSP